jgi:hypothetical protein
MEVISMQKPRCCVCGKFCSKEFQIYSKSGEKYYHCGAHNHEEVDDVINYDREY